MNLYGFWGPEQGIDTHDYILEIEGNTPASPPQKLPGHSLDNPNIDQSDALTITRVRLVGGRFKTVTVTKRAPEERGRQYTVGFPNGALDSPVLAAALRPGCYKDVFMKYLCPQDTQYNHADIFKSVLFDPPQPAGALIAIADINPVDYTSIIRVSEQSRQFQLGWSIVFTDVTASMEYGAISFINLDCAGCDELPGETFVFAGGDGTAVPSARKTVDRFGSTPSTLTPGGTATHLGTVLFSEGNLVILGTADENRLGAATAAAGQLKVSRDGGATWASAAGVSITAPIYGITKLGDILIAVGGTGAGVPVMYSSSDAGKTWAAVTNALITGTASFLDVAADNEAGVAYVVGETGDLFSIRVSGTSLQLSNIAAALPGSPGTLNRVAVLAKNFIAVGGVAGYYAESYDGGVSWTQISVAGSTAITAIGGDRYRTVVGAGTGLYVRDVITDLEFVPVVLDGGVANTGTIMDVKMRSGTLDDFNMFFAVTTDAEVIQGKDYRPTS